MKKPYIYIIVITVILLYLIPPFVHLETQPKPYVKFSLPYVVRNATDEPIYLVMLNSLLEDRDLDLVNNYYDIAHRDSLAGGKLSRGKLQERNSFVFDEKMKLVTYGSNPAYAFDAFKKGFFVLSGGKIKQLAQLREYSMLSPFFPILTSLVLWPFKNSPYLESAAIMLTTIVSLLAVCFLYKLLLFFCKNERVSLFIAASFALAIPLWHYAGTFYKEPYVITLLLIAFYYFLVKNYNFLPGAALAISFLLKLPTGIFILFLCLYRLRSNKFREALILLLSSVPAVFLWRLLNGFKFNFYPPVYYLLNFQSAIISIIFLVLCILFIYAIVPHILRKGRLFRFYIIPISLLLFLLLGWWLISRILFSYHHGIIIFSPLLIFSLLGLPRFSREHPEECVLIFSCLAAFLVIYRTRFDWWGGGICFANRYYLVVIPFLALSLSSWYLANKNKLLKFLFFISIFISFGINLIGAFANHIVRGQGIYDVLYKPCVILARLFV